MGMKFTVDLSDYASLQHFEDVIERDVKIDLLSENVENLEERDRTATQTEQELQNQILERDYRIEGLKSQIEYLSPN
jgi:hypothetical protein